MNKQLLEFLYRRKFDLEFHIKQEIHDSNNPTIKEDGHWPYILRTTKMELLNENLSDINTLLDQIIPQ